MQQLNATFCNKNGKCGKKNTENQKAINSFSANTPVNLILIGEKTIQMSN